MRSIKLILVMMTALASVLVLCGGFIRGHAIWLACLAEASSIVPGYIIERMAQQGERLRATVLVRRRRGGAGWLPTGEEFCW